jgi:predicted nucleic acid-binding protein
MAARIRVLVDLNVVLDVLQGREPFYTSSAQVLANLETGAAEGAIAAHAVTTLFYLIAKSGSADQARATLTEILRFLSIAAVDQEVTEEALNLPYRDFEDAVQMMAAVHYGAQYLITRNVQDYQTGPLSALRPVEFLALLGA